MTTMKFHFLLLPLFMLLLLFGGWRLMSAHGEVSVPRQNPATFTAKHWEGLFTAAAELPLGQRIALWADLAAVDAVYVGDPLGEGPDAKPDDGPLCDFARVDCVTYVEQVYALALSPDYAQFPDTLRRIRYKDGQIDYRWRNHYAVSDWLPANAWFIRDVTGEVGAGVTRIMRKTISRAKFFGDKGLKQYADIPDEAAETEYIPRDKVEEVLPKLKTGDLVIFVIETPGIIAGHTGIIRNPGVVSVQHASLTDKKVVISPLVDYVKSVKRFVGIKVARPFTPPAEE